MPDPPPSAAGKLDEIIDEFADLEPRERLELLLDFANGLPALPAELEAKKAAGENRVHECQTPVFLWVEVTNGAVAIHADVAEEAPTVKGFVAILVEAFAGAEPQEVLQTKPNLLVRMGLQQALGMTRMRGLNAILYRIRMGVEKAAG